MLASILVLTKNEERNVGTCLAAVCSQQGESDYEVIVIDSGSSDSTLEIASGFPVRIVQIRAEEFHHARTRNYAAELARGDILVYLVADAFPVNQYWLRGLLGNFSDPCVGAVYGRHIPKPGSRMERRQALGTLYGETRIVKDLAKRRELGYRFYHFSDVNSAIRKEVWRQTRFPEELRVFEDVGIAKRILDGGWKIVYEPNAAVYHSHEYPASMLFRRYFDIGVVFRRLRIWDGTVSVSMRQTGWRLFWERLSLVPQRDDWRELGTTAFYDLLKYAGLQLGKNERLLPLSVKKRLSAFRLFD